MDDRDLDMVYYAETETISVIVTLILRYAPALLMSASIVTKLLACCVREDYSSSQVESRDSHPQERRIQLHRSYSIPKYTNI